MLAAATYSTYLEEYSTGASRKTSDKSPPLVQSTPIQQNSCARTTDRMTETEQEPQYTTLAARIAALNSQGVGKALVPHSPNTPTGRKPPPPPPPGARPSLSSRTQTVNNPPTSYGSSVGSKPSNLPQLGTRGQVLLPPPPVDRDQPQTKQLQITNGTPALPARNGPPPLPSRKSSQPSPNLPGRRTSTQLTPNANNTMVMARRGSSSSFSSTVSGMSLGQSTSASSFASEGRRLPPALGETKLPPLPPTKREREEKEREVKEREAREFEAKERAREAREQERGQNQMPVLTTTKSAPQMHQMAMLSDREAPPPMPARPRMPLRPNTIVSNIEDAPPPMPMRPRSGNEQIEDGNGPRQPARRLPLPARSALSMGFGNKPATNGTSYAQGEAPNPAPRPAPVINTPRPKPTGPSVVELTSDNFDRSIRDKFAFVKFYGPQCIRCKQLAPDWNQLGEDFAFAQDRLIIAKVNMADNKGFHQITSGPDGYTHFPTLVMFNSEREEHRKYEGEKELESLTEFVERVTGIKKSEALTPRSNGVPPPINLSSKPSAHQVQAVQSHPPKQKTADNGCLICRDFTEPDYVAAQHPISSLPSRDVTGYLARVLCDPFPSHTDKARAIFTWMHHNIAYDVDAFFGNRVKHVEAQDTIKSGLAVCGGYAGAFVAIALKAGMEAIMVTGHGKGFGYAALKEGERVPPVSATGHAWNAFRMDDGQWKLIDCCWGAGHLGAGNAYNKKFSPKEFTASNEDFGLKHFPENRNHFYRADGRALSWEEYYRGPNNGEGPTTFSNGDGLGINQFSFEPKLKNISVSDPNEVIRFQFSKSCEHWDHEVNGQGKPFVLVLHINGDKRAGKKDDYVPLEYDGYWWWADIRAADLGAPGDRLGCFSVDVIEGRSARGVTREEYLRKKGKVAMGPFGGVAGWELVA